MPVRRLTGVRNSAIKEHEIPKRIEQTAFLLGDEGVFVIPSHCFIFM
jgi:hypothetical protein